MSIGFCVSSKPSRHLGRGISLIFCAASRNVLNLFTPWREPSAKAGSHTWFIALQEKDAITAIISVSYLLTLQLFGLAVGGCR